MGRHRHAINVRADGLASVLGQLLQDPAVLVALLVDADSGMVMDACGPQSSSSDLEQLGAAHGELMRLALGPAVGLGAAERSAAGDCELVVSLDGDRHLVLRRVPDPHGDRLALSVLVAGPPRALRRTRRRLREVSAAALTAGPTVSLRPVEGAWVPGVTEERPVLPVRPRPVPAPPTPPAPAAPVASSALAAMDMPVGPRPGGAPPVRPRPGSGAGGRFAAAVIGPAVIGPAVIGPRASGPGASGQAMNGQAPNGQAPNGQARNGRTMNGPTPADPQAAEPRPAPPSALPPPAQRSESD